MRGLSCSLELPEEADLPPTGTVAATPRGQPVLRASSMGFNTCPEGPYLHPLNLLRQSSSCLVYLAGLDPRQGPWSVIVQQTRQGGDEIRTGINMSSDLFSP